jgi:hypothetical protein
MSINLRKFTVQSFATAWPTLKSAATTTLARGVEYAPIFGARAVRRRNRVVIGPYARNRTLLGTLLWLTAVPAGLALCLVYGMFFGLTAPYLIVHAVVPIAIMIGLIIWALPDQRTAPTLPIEFLFAGYFVAKTIWPTYLAISLPGLPWISLLRIIAIPLAVFFLVSLSVSKQFRAYTYDSVTSINSMWICAIGFSIVQFLTTFISAAPLDSAQLVFDQHLNFTLIFLIGCVVFRKHNMVEKYFVLLCLLSTFIIIITFIENYQKHIIWAEHIPNILHPPSPHLKVVLESTYRMYTNIYRAKATFLTPLALAEFISLITPFFIYFGMSKIKLPVRALCFLMIPATFIAVRMTDARLGVVGVFVSVLMYGLLWSYQRWRSNPRDLFAAATVFGYPAAFLAAVGAIFASTRLSNMVFGGGAHAGSTEARFTQLGMASSAFWQQPWGHGAGRSGAEMGFSKDAFITIDNFFITLQLDYGLFGIIFWYGMFLIGIGAALFHSMMDRYSRSPEAGLLVPIAVSLTAFLIIKWVHGQDENHSIYFMMLGMISALVYRLRHVEASPRLAPGTTVAISPQGPTLRS